MSSERVFIGIGSNIGDRRAHINAGIEALDEDFGIDLVSVSRVRETQPVGPVPGQGTYLNAAVHIRTELAPGDLLAALLDIERANGRDRSAEARWGPRTLDLDLLIFGERVVDEPGLSVPHPRLTERRFVLEPLADLAPDLTVPGTGLTVAEHLAALIEEGV